MLLGAPVLMVSIYMLSMAPRGIGAAYIVVWLLAMYLGTSMLTLAHSAWAASLAPTYDARSRIFGVMGAAGVGGMTLLLAMPVIAPRLGLSEDGLGVHGMGWFIIAAIPLAVFLTVVRRPERLEPQAPSQGFAARHYAALLLHPSMGRIVLATFLFTLGTTWEGTLFMFYFTDVPGFTTAEASTVLMVALAAGLLGAPALAHLSTKISKHGALMSASALYAVCLASLAFIPNDAALLACIPFVTTGFLYAGFRVLLRAMTADVADEIRLDQNQDRGGLLYALITLAPKISAAIAVWATFSLLAHVGYQPSAGTANTAGALKGVWAGYVLGPITFVALGGLCTIGYPLTRERTAEIHRRLETCRRHAGSGPEPTSSAPAPSRA